MEKEEVIESFKELMKINPPLVEIERLFNKAINSGALNFEEEDQPSFRISKTIYHAILCTMAEQWQPYHKIDREESKNLKKFL